MSDAALWYGVPIAGGAMLVRILINSENALFGLLAQLVFLAMMLEQQAVFAIFFIISGVVAAASLMHTKERLNILRSGLQTGLVNAALALVIGSPRGAHLPDAGAGGETQPLWDVGIAVSGGIVSFMALGLVPCLRPLDLSPISKCWSLPTSIILCFVSCFLRAPGTYHHSMTMAQLSEAAADTIGANALHTPESRVTIMTLESLFSLTFIENQRGINPHDSLRPHQSARVIITHVTDGIALGEQYDLPKPIMDAIWTSSRHQLGQIFLHQGAGRSRRGRGR